MLNIHALNLIRGCILEYNLYTYDNVLENWVIKKVNNPRIKE